MFSQGQLYFAAFFVVAFVIIMLYAYKKDLQLHKFYYRGSGWILGAFLLFIGLIFFIKTFFKE